MDLLKGKKGLIFGALNEQSIAWQVAEVCRQEGAELVLTNAPVALRMGSVKQLAQQLDAPLIACDVCKIEDLEQLISQTQTHFGGRFDFVLHSVGMSLNIRKNKPYTGLNYDYLQQTLDISAISFHKLMQTMWEKDALNDWGSIVALTYIGAQRTFPHYSEMSQAKALLESFARSFGYHWGTSKKVRVNTVSQSPTPTTAGSGIAGFDTFLEQAAKNSPLGNAPARACAEYCATLFSDYTRYVTMQNLFHDGGFSSMGASE